MKYYIIAGEASGDLHGSNLMKALKSYDTEATFRFWGGDLMTEQGGNPVKHIKDLAYMGIVQVIANLPAIFRNLKLCKNDIIQFKPDVVILIDYAGFNLKIAEFAKTNNIRVHYYISPKIWAWKTKRVEKIKKFVDRMFTILPFETEFYKKYNYRVDYVGNPVNDAIAEYKKHALPKDEFIKNNNLGDKPIVALLAGSRKQEISRMLPIMIQTSHFFPNYQFVIAGAPGMDKSFYHKYIKAHKIPILYDQTYDILNNSKAALVTSGTATLETGLFHIPQIVCYDTNTGTLLYKFVRSLLKVKWISLVNIILGYEAVKELTQDTFKVKYLVKELDMILHKKNYRNSMLKSYDELSYKIGTPGASKKAAQLIIEDIKNQHNI